MQEREQDAAADTESAAEVKTEEQLWDELNAEFEAPPDPDRAVFTSEDTEPEEEPATDPVDEQDDGPDEDESPSEDSADSEDDAATGPDLQKQIAELKHKLEAENGRHKAAIREANNLKAKLARAEKSAPAGDGDDPTDDALSEVREEYPEIAGPLAAKMEALQAKIDALEGNTREDVDTAKERLDEIYQEEQAVFLTEHPDGFDFLKANRQTFDAWIDDQPRADRELYAQNSSAITNGTGAAYILSRFKEHLAGGPEPKQRSGRRKKQLQGGVSGNSRTGGIANVPPADDADEQVLWDYWNKNGVF